MLSWSASENGVPPKTLLAMFPVKWQFYRSIIFLDKSVAQVHCELDMGLLGIVDDNGIKSRALSGILGYYIHIRL